MSKARPDRIQWWLEKIARYGEHSFGPSVSHWALHVLVLLVDSPTRSVESPNLNNASEMLGVPRKYISRALALLTRSGLVMVANRYPIRIVLNHGRILKHKNSAQKVRGRISLKERARLLQEDGYRCGHCGAEFSLPELEIDHIVPVSLLGADEHGNWIAICHQHNREKWHNFDSRFIRYYRGRPVKGSVGVRFRSGFFWPYINGKTCVETRETLREKL